MDITLLGKMLVHVLHERPVLFLKGAIKVQKGR